MTKKKTEEELQEAQIDDIELSKELEQKLQTFYVNHVKSKFEEIDKTVTSIYGKTTPELNTLEEDGIFNEGIPFFHTKARDLKDSAIKRLLDCDHEIRRGNFSPKEDRQIRRNWSEFCKISKTFTEKDGTNVLGMAGEDRKIGKKLVKEPFFYPWMCRGLLDRAAVQVYRRCQVIFHPGNLENGKERPWSQTEIQELLRLAEKYPNKWQEIGLKMKRPRFHVYYKYQRLQEEGKVVEEEEHIQHKVLYAQLAKAFKMDPLIVATKKPNVIEAYEEKVIWSEMAEFVGLDKLKCKQIWKDLKTAVRETVQEQASVDARLIKTALPEYLRGFATPPKRVTLWLNPQEISEALSVFLAANEETLQEKYSYRHLKMRFLTCDSLLDFDETKRRLLATQIFYVVHRFDNNGFFNAIPPEHRNVFCQLACIKFAFERLGKKPVIDAKKIGKYVIEFLESNGWTPQTKVFAYTFISKTDRTEVDKVVEESENKKKMNLKSQQFVEESHSEAEDEEKEAKKAKKKKRQIDPDEVQENGHESHEDEDVEKEAKKGKKKRKNGPEKVQENGHEGNEDADVEKEVKKTKKKKRQSDSEVVQENGRESNEDVEKEATKQKKKKRKAKNNLEAQENGHETIEDQELDESSPKKKKSK